MIAIIQGLGANIASVRFALERLGKQSIVTDDPVIIKNATHVILPGVGTAKQAMEQLEKSSLIDCIRKLQQPVLGICLGMQLLFEHSMEGDVPCLGIFPGIVAAIPTNSCLTIPHMGWNQLQLLNSDSRLIKDIENQSYVYFVHSYFAAISQYTIAITDYAEAFSAMVNYNNFFGMQFHPERSGKVGETLLRNFINL